MIYNRIVWYWEDYFHDDARRSLGEEVERNILKSIEGVQSNFFSLWKAKEIIDHLMKSFIMIVNSLILFLNFNLLMLESICRVQWENNHALSELQIMIVSILNSSLLSMIFSQTSHQVSPLSHRMHENKHYC